MLHVLSAQWIGCSNVGTLWIDFCCDIFIITKTAQLLIQTYLFSSVLCTKRVVHKLRWQISGLFDPPSPPGWHICLWRWQIFALFWLPSPIAVNVVCERPQREKNLIECCAVSEGMKRSCLTKTHCEKTLIIRGCSQITLRIFHYFLTTHPWLCFVHHFTNHLPYKSFQWLYFADHPPTSMAYVICECPLIQPIEGKWWILHQV